MPDFSDIGDREPTNPRRCRGTGIRRSYLLESAVSAPSRTAVTVAKQECKRSNAGPLSKKAPHNTHRLFFSARSPYTDAFLPHGAHWLSYSQDRSLACYFPPVDVRVFRLSYHCFNNAWYAWPPLSPFRIPQIRIALCILIGTFRLTCRNSAPGFTRAPSTTGQAFDRVPDCPRSKHGRYRCAGRKIPDSTSLPLHAATRRGTSTSPSTPRKY